jgi:hypothetical protein
VTSPQRPALFVDGHPGLAQRPVANDLTATLQRRIILLGACRIRLCRAIDHGLAGDELGAAIGARGLRYRCQRHSKDPDGKSCGDRH